MSNWKHHPNTRISLEELDRYKSMIRMLCNIIESEYPESDERYQFAMNCLTDVGAEK